MRTLELEQADRLWLLDPLEAMSTEELERAQTNERNQRRC
jgi:hypothetical protein